jgi:phytoene dehydrogenase-like protein
MEKSVIIVGAGMAGLSAACYARMNGYRTHLFEMHTKPGGLCTAWHRKGYTFDISMHMLTGSHSGPYHKMWEELGIIQNFKFYYHDHIALIEGMGRKLLLSADRKKLEDDMIRISPDDARLIREFISLLYGPDITKSASLEPAEFTSFIKMIRTLPSMINLMPLFRKYGKITLQQFADKFSDPFLRKAVKFFIDTPGWPMPDFPLPGMIGFIKRGVTEAGTPLGGSQKVAFHLEELLRELGGVISYSSRIVDLISEDDRVKGVRLQNGTEYIADNVIWAADGHTLHFKILSGKYLNERISRMYNSWFPVKPIVHVMLGVNRDLSGEPHKLILEIDPIEIGGRKHTWMSVINHSFDKSMAPAGKSEIEAWFDTEYEYWEHLAATRKEYNSVRKNISDHVIRQLEKRWPGISAQVEVTDVPTPVTYVNYTGNWKGSPDGWYLTMDNIGSMEEPMRNIPGLEGLYLAGQWTSPFSGTVFAALTGRQIIELLCRKDGKKFITDKEKATIPKEIIVTE